MIDTVHHYDDRLHTCIKTSHCDNQILPYAEKIQYFVSSVL